MPYDSKNSSSLILESVRVATHPDTGFISFKFFFVNKQTNSICESKTSIGKVNDSRCFMISIDNSFFFESVKCCQNVMRRPEMCANVRSGHVSFQNFKWGNVDKKFLLEQDIWQVFFSPFGPPMSVATGLVHFNMWAFTKSTRDKLRYNYLFLVFYLQHSEGAFYREDFFLTKSVSNFVEIKCYWKLCLFICFLLIGSLCNSLPTKNLFCLLPTIVHWQ